MEDNKSATLINESNSLYDKLNSLNNIYVPQILSMLAQFGISETSVSVSALSTKQKGQLLVTLCDFEKVIGDNIANRTFETSLEGAGYASPGDAYADIPNRFAGQTATILQTNLAKVGETVALLDSLIDDNTLILRLQKLISIKNKVVEVAPQMNRV